MTNKAHNFEKALVKMLDMSIDEVRASLKTVVEAQPGVVVMEGIQCRAAKPAGPEVHNLYISECTGMLLNHIEPHSWEGDTSGMKTETQNPAAY